MGSEDFRQGMLCLHKSSQYLFFACSRIEITGRKPLYAVLCPCMTSFVRQDTGRVVCDLTDKKIRRLAEPGYDIFFLCMLVFSLVGFFFHGVIVGTAEAIAVFILWLLYRQSSRRKKREIIQYMESVTLEVNSAGSLAVADFPLPLAVVHLDDGQIIWGNERFQELIIKYTNIEDLRISEAFDGFQLSDLHELASGERSDTMVTCGDAAFRIYGEVSHTPGYENICTLTFIDVSGEMELANELDLMRPVVALIQVDNYEELVKDLSSYESTLMMANIESCITKLCEMAHAISMRNDEHYTLIFEERYLADCEKSRFDVLDEVRKIKTPSGMSATLSIGIGCEGNTYTGNLTAARLAMDMALSRGGDQAVIKNQQTYEFFGGSTREVEKRTKVRSRVISNAVADLIRNSSLVIAMGHRYSDMDSLGSCVGIACICRKLGVPVRIVYDPRTTSAAVLYQKLREISEYQDLFISGDRAMELMTEETLLIVTDVSRPGFVDAPQVLQAAQRIVVIDHHRRASDYIDNAMISLHEPYASSASELVSEMMQYVLTPGDLLRQEAECMLAGIMLDTKSFTMKTGVRTFEAAAFLRRAGADTIEVKCLFADDMNDYFDRCDIIKTAEKYRSGIAIAYSEKEVPKAIAAQAADELLCIEGIQGSFVVFRFGNATHISGRSLGKINVQIVLERLGGGGSMMEAGAQLGDRPVPEVIDELKASINAYESMI